MERRTFLLGLIGGLAAATGLVITGTAPAEASTPQSTRGAEGPESAEEIRKSSTALPPRMRSIIAGGGVGSIAATTGTRQALLQARTPPVLLLKRWSAEVSEWASSSVRKGRRSHCFEFGGPSTIARHREWHYDLVRGCCALPLRWSLPRPREPRRSPEKARFLFLFSLVAVETPWPKQGEPHHPR